MDAYSTISPENVYNILQTSTKIKSEYVDAYSEFGRAFFKKHQRQPNIDERRQIQASAYSFIQFSSNQNEDNLE